MNNKLRQVTDSIHGTIYLSVLESEFISTPYFYRLHDIYQSSTVYMTFPSNRTKRYEHSIGTMELASDILFSSLSNADRKTRELFFREVNSVFSMIYSGVMGFHSHNAPYLQRANEDLDALFNYQGSKQPTVDEFFKNEVKEAYRNEVMEDSALDQYQFYSISTTQDRNLSLMRDSFLYRSILQAVRLVALFHDVGHPPFSHIIEDVINELYEIVDKEDKGFVKERRNTFLSCLRPFLSNDEVTSYHCDMILTKSSLLNAHTHERIGLALLQNAVNDVIPEQIKVIATSNCRPESKRTKIMYYISVVEIALAILTEESDFLKSLHRIINGYVDADRLDYVMRDSVNSGVDWGHIPYKRLIQSCKMIKIGESNKSAEEKSENSPNCFQFSIAFQKKSSDDITDMLVTRYKIFARINFHHRCIKTGATLKACVRDLSLDYLSNKDSKFADISMLWESLENTRAGNFGVRIIQWNDSWLVSSLHKALVYVPKEAKYQHLKANLEEILLNKKRYYGLLKRGDEEKSFVSKITELLNNDRTTVDNVISCNQRKLGVIDSNTKTNTEDGVDINMLFSDEGDARDSIERLSIINSIREEGDLSLLEISLPPHNKSIEKSFDIVLSELKKNGDICDYQVYVNKGREKNGVPKHENQWDNIYLYNGDSIEVFDENHGLLEQLESIQNCVSKLNIYFIPSNTDNVVKVRERIINDTIKKLVPEFLKREMELFGLTEQSGGNTDVQSKNQE